MREIKIEVLWVNETQELDQKIETHYTSVDKLTKGLDKFPYNTVEIIAKRQHTVLKDCEGTEIYEGDVLIFDWAFQDSGQPYTPECKDIKGVVNWEKGKFVVYFFKNSMSFDLSDINQSTFERFWSQEYRSSTDFFKMTGFKVIGNIHQHKHLLEV